MLTDTLSFIAPHFLMECLLPPPRRYYNNKNTNEPRYWCNNCNKYYTHGGKTRKPPIIVRARNPPAPSVAMEVADNEEEEAGDVHVNVVEDENNNESEASIENTEEEANVAQERPGIKRLHISADASRESKLVPTLGALRTQRRKGAH